MVNQKIGVFLPDQYQSEDLKAFFQGVRIPLEFFQNEQDLRKIDFRQSPRPVVTVLGNLSSASRVKNLLAACPGFRSNCILVLEEPLTPEQILIRPGEFNCSRIYYGKQKLNTLRADLDLLQRARQEFPEEARVLILDDDPDWRHLFGRMLEKEGIAIDRTGTVTEALRALNEFQPDVCLLDFDLDRSIGPDLIPFLRANVNSRDCGIIVVSADGSPERERLCYEKGADNFLDKGHRDSILQAVKHRALGARIARAETRRLRQTSLELRNQQAALHEHAIVSVTDREGDIVFVNDRFCEISGYSAEELIGQNHRIIKSDQHGPDFFGDLWATISRGEIWKGVICNRTRTGEEYWVNSTIVPFLDESGEPYQYVSVRTDISKIIKGQQALLLSEERLRRSQIFANIGTWDWNIETGDLYWSERIGPLFGYEPGKIETTYENFLAAIHPEDRQSVTEAVNAAVEMDATYNIEHRVVWQDGTVRWAHESGAVLRDDNGRALRMLGVVRDITYQKEVEAELRKAIKAAEKASRAKSRFLSNMSHELRTPLNSILGFSQLLEMNARELGAEHTAQVKEITKAGHHLLGLIDEVLDLARIESGSQEVKLMDVDLSGLFTEIETIMGALGQKADVAVRFDRVDGKIVRADPDLLKRVIMNFCTNAIKYNLPGGRVNVSANCLDDEAPDCTIRICVADTGRGIAREQQEKLFQPFQRLGFEKSTIEGTGIGLVIVRELVESMGGRVGFSSEPGQGSEFWVDLPGSRLAAAAPDRPDKDEDPLATLELDQGTILYVEDNPINVLVLSQFFKRFPGITFITAESAEEGLERAEARTIDLFLLDINLPGSSGFQLLKKIRERSAYVRTPVFAISADAMRGDVERGIAAGFDGYFAKPIDFAKLGGEVEKVLRLPDD